MHKICAKSRLNKKYIQKGYNPILAMLFDEFPELKIESGKLKVVSNGAKNASLRSSLPGWGGLGWGDIVGQAPHYFTDVQLKIENVKLKINLPSLKGEGEAVVEQKRNLRIRVREQSHFQFSTPQRRCVC
jgi:hypothetical protein